jgi:uncharacterized protein
MIEAKTMVQVEDMSDKDSRALLKEVGYGHLGLARDSHPYVVPIHYAYEEPYIYIFTTEGKKTEIIEDNPKVCLQVEKVIDGRNWQSVIVTGDAIQLTTPKEVEHAMNLITETNPALTPALSIRWMDQWIRANVDVIYRIRPAKMSGRTTADRLNHKNW